MKAPRHFKPHAPLAPPVSACVLLLRRLVPLDLQMAPMGAFVVTCEGPIAGPLAATNRMDLVIRSRHAVLNRHRRAIAHERTTAIHVAASEPFLGLAGGLLLGSIYPDR